MCPSFSSESLTENASLVAELGKLKVPKLLDSRLGQGDVGWLAL